MDAMLPQFIDKERFPVVFIIEQLLAKGGDAVVAADPRPIAVADVEGLRRYLEEA